MSKGQRPKKALEPSGVEMRREAFCLGIARGLSQTQAAIQAGFAEKWADATAVRLMKETRVLQRISALRVKVEEKGEITREWWLSRLKTFASFNLSDLLKINDDGTASLDLKKATPEQLQAIEKYFPEIVMVGDANDGFPILKLKVETVDRLKALDMIGKAQGYYAPVKVAQTDTAGNDVIDPELELRARLAAVVQRLPRGGAVEPGPADSGVGA